MRTVERIGWYKNAFVLPDETIGPTNGEMVRLQSAREQQHCYGTAGSLDDWQRNVAFYCQGNSLLAFAVSCAFAAPLLPFTEDQGGGFHLIADTTVGKSTILMAAGSVWGGGPQNGFLQSWLTAANGLENTAEWAHHCLLCLDELKLIEPEEAGKAAYSLSNGQRKVRQNREGYAQRKAEWQLLFLSNGELSLETHLEGIGRRFYGGQAVRFCEIPACMHEKYGAFEKLHCFGSAKDLADHLKHHTRERCYGTAGRAFLRKLTEHDHDVIVATVKKSVSEFMRRYVPEGLSAEVTRAADRFALVSAAGDLATQLGVTGWKKGKLPVLSPYALTPGTATEERTVTGTNEVSSPLCGPRCSRMAAAVSNIMRRPRNRMRTSPTTSLPYTTVWASKRETLIAEPNIC